MEDFSLLTTLPRRGTHCVKYDAPNVDADVICAGVADMDFQIPKQAREAIISLGEYGIFGYTVGMEDRDWTTICHWLRDQRDWQVEKEWMLYSPGVIPSLRAAVRAVTQEGDPIVIEPPVYPPFFGVIRDARRTVVESRLDKIDGHWQRNWDRLEKALQGAKAMILCSPHNPIGRVWTLEEQERLAQLLIKYDVTLICDEIHADLTMPGVKHISIAKLPGMEERTITAFAPTKTFNLAALHISTVLTQREDWRKALAEQLNWFGGPTVVAQEAQRSCYLHGLPWLEQLRRKLDQNNRILVDALNESGFPCTPLEGTYLVWGDMSRLGKKGDELTQFMTNTGRIFTQSGEPFGSPEYLRFNSATDTDTVKEMARRIKRL